MKHLRVSLILIVLLLGIAGAAIFTANAGAPVGGNALTPRVYLPLVARGELAPDPGTWITVMAEGFEDAPGAPWQFRDDNDADPKVYQWGRRRCPSKTGNYSAWAAGGGADGANLTCDDAYPDNIQTTMIYGPFSLADAKMAQMRFELRYDQLLDNTFAWGASSDGTVFRGRWLNGQQTGWTPLDLDLGDLDPGTPGVSVLGEPQVWVAFLFTGDATGHASSGPFVDDVVIRKCLDTLCRLHRDEKHDWLEALREAFIMPPGSGRLEPPHEAARERGRSDAGPASRISNRTPAGLTPSTSSEAADKPS